MNTILFYRNCPKYITLRELAPVNDSKFPDIEPSATQPRVVEDRLHLSPEDCLSKDAISFIHGADTIFLGSAYIAPADEAKAYPSHLGMNHRGGRPGFVRVKGDGRTVVVPDFSGISISSCSSVRILDGLLISFAFVIFL